MSEGVDWFKSSYSGGNGGDCVETSSSLLGVGQVPVRDSKNPQGPALAFTSDAWASFIAGVKAGNFQV